MLRTLQLPWGVTFLGGPRLFIAKWKYRGNNSSFKNILISPAKPHRNKNLGYFESKKFQKNNLNNK